MNKNQQQEILGLGVVAVPIATLALLARRSEGGLKRFVRNSLILTATGAAGGASFGYILTNRGKHSVRDEAADGALAGGMFVGVAGSLAALAYEAFRSPPRESFALLRHTYRYFRRS